MSHKMFENVEAQVEQILSDAVTKLEYFSATWSILDVT